MKSVIFGIVGFVVGAVMGYALWFLAIASAGAGHGSYSLAKIFFPYTMAATAWTQHITDAEILIGLCSYAAYGTVLGAGMPTRRRKAVTIAIAMLHTAAVVASLVLTSSAF